MSEFIKIGDIPSLFNTLKSTIPPNIDFTPKATPNTENKSYKGLIVIGGVILIGFIAYKVYRHYEEKKELARK